jgi:hypothetical protein
MTVDLRCVRKNLRFRVGTRLDPGVHSDQVALHACSSGQDESKSSTGESGRITRRANRSSPLGKQA